LTEQLQIEEQTQTKDLQLLIEWPSPWQEFLTAIGPALARSPRPLAGEAQSGLFPYRNMPLVCLAEFLLLVFLAILPDKQPRRPSMTSSTFQPTSYQEPRTMAGPRLAKWAGLAVCMRFTVHRRFAWFVAMCCGKKCWTPQN
jgi:hypothetical protein